MGADFSGRVVIEMTTFTTVAQNRTNDGQKKEKAMLLIAQ